MSDSVSLVSVLRKLSAMNFNVVFIPPYNHADEVKRVTACLNRWNLQTFRRAPYHTGRPVSASESADRSNIGSHSARSGVLQSTAETESAGPSLLTILPGEVMLEIVRHLSPRDLISLSRVNRNMYDRLTSRRDGRRFWCASLNSVPGLPACPLDISERRYAALVFGTDCMGCGAPAGRHDSISLGWRFCDECHKINIVSEDEVTNRFIRTLLQRGLIWHPLFRELEVRDVLPCCWIYPHSIADQPVRSFYEPEVDQFFAEYLPLVCMLIERGRAAHEVLSVVVRNRRGYVAYRQQLLAAMDAWSASLMPPRTLREQILDRVALLGYTAEHFPQGRSDIDTLLDEYRPLTDEVWARTRPFLLVEMESNLEAEQERIWESDWEMGTDEDKDVVEIPALMGLVDETSDIDSPAVEVHAADAWP